MDEDAHDPRGREHLSCPVPRCPGRDVGEIAVDPAGSIRGARPEILVQPEAPRLFHDVIVGPVIDPQRLARDVIVLDVVAEQAAQRGYQIFRGLHRLHRGELGVVPHEHHARQVLGVMVATIC